MRHRVVGDESAIECDGFPVEGVGQGFVGGGGISERTCSQRNSTDEVFVQFAIEAEPDANASAVPVLGAGLRVILAAYPDVSRKPEATQQSFCAFELCLFL